MKLEGRAIVLFVAAGLLAAEPALPSSAYADSSRISAEFVLTVAQLQTMTQALPEGMRAGIMASPRDFLDLVAATLDEPSDFFVLVDKTHKLPSDYAPDDLVNLKAYPLRVSWGDLLVRKAIVPELLAMTRAAKADGITLVYSSGYRSYEYQRYVFAKEVKTYGQEMAERESARPGASQHQLGTAIDFGSVTDAFAQTRAGKWLVAHAWEFGFSLSYPEGDERITGYRYESWHYRFITKPGALLQRKFFGDIQQYLLEFLDENRTALEAKRLKKG